MNPKRRATVAAACLVVASAFWGAKRAAAQPPEAAPASVAVIDQRLIEMAQDQSLDDDARASIRGLYQQALSELEAAARWRVTALDFSRRTTEAPAALEDLEASMTAPAAGAPPISAADGLDTLEQRRAEVERQLQEAASRLTEADAEPLGRTSRRGEIRETLAELAEEAAGIEADPAVPAASDASPMEAEARRSLLAARRLHIASHSAALDRELVAYDAERLLLPHRRELAARDVARLQEQLDQLDAATAALRRLDASRQANEARAQANRLGLVAGSESERTRQVLLALATTNNALTARR